MENNNKNLGSSETIREASQKHAFQAYIPYCPQHRLVDIQFLQWFIGFFEGDGNFQLWEQDGKLRFAAQLTQKDEILLRNLRTELGFGRIVYITANNGKKYPQLRFDTRQNLLALVHLCAGNLRLKKVQARFLPWAESICKHFNKQVPVNLEGLAQQPLSLENPWLSGFFQADGGFYAQYRKDTRYQKGYRIALRAYIDQKEEIEFLQEFSKILGGHVQLRSAEKSHYRSTIGTGFQPLVEYFTRFPLRGKKKIAQSRWVSLVNYMENYELPEPDTKSFYRLIRRVKHVNACSR